MERASAACHTCWLTSPRINRPVLLAAAAIVALAATPVGHWPLASAAGPEPSKETAMKHARKQAAHRRRIIVNNDGSTCLGMVSSRDAFGPAWAVMSEHSRPASGSVGE